MSEADDIPWILRPAESGDCRLYWEWANDPQVRAMAFHHNSIPWEDHQRWFANRLASPQSHLFVLASREGEPSGQVRFDQAGDGAFEIDVSVAPAWRGHGLARFLLTLGEFEMARRTHTPHFRAVVKVENAASLALFRHAGYQERGATLGPGQQEAVVLEKTHAV